LVKLTDLDLYKNELQNLPKSFLNIKKSLYTDISTYEITNLSEDTEILIFSELKQKLTNLPTGLKEIWISEEKRGLEHKLPFGCVIKYF
jgi:Leucine-rich repeat (LRR) protein